MSSNLNINSASTKKIFRGWGLLFLIASYSFLVYKLLTFNQYSELLYQWKEMPHSRFSWLVGILLLLPFNWLLESVKWKMLTIHVQEISLRSSIKGVLAGISTGFFTPNRVGELVGRIMYLEPQNHKSGVTLSFLNSLTQNLIMTLCGIPACILFFASTIGKIEINYIYYLALLVVCLIGFGIAYFFLPQLSSRFKQSQYFLNINQFTDCLSDFQKKELVGVILISLVRYVVFCVQFFFMLRFFGIELAIWQALVAIPTNYLFVTFTPSLAFSEVGVRSSFAMLTIGAFSGQIVNIALAGMCIWLINFVIPMLAGSVVIVRKNNFIYLPDSKPKPTQTEPVF